MAKSFGRYFLYYVFISTCGFFIGRILPKSWFRHDTLPYRCHSFEKEGKLYEKLGIKRWQNRLPDMSRLFTRLMPRKKMQSVSPERLQIMIRETCIAEFTHRVLCVLGLYGLSLWDSSLRFHLTGFYIVGLNLPYILIQRYNRPRLLRVLNKAEQKANAA